MLLLLTEGRLCNWYSRGIYEFTVRRLGVGSSLLGAGQCLATDFCTREGHIQSAEGALQDSLGRSPGIRIPERLAPKVRFNILLFGMIE
jgi:hypothetical protein